MTVEPRAPRYRVEPLEDGIRVSIPFDYRAIEPYQWFLTSSTPIMFLAALLFGPGGETSLDRVTTLIVGGVALVSGLGALAILASLRGLHEVLTLTGGVLERRVEFWGFRSSGTRLAADAVSGLRMEVASGGDILRSWLDTVGRRFGPIAMEHDGESVRFGLWVSEAEARMVVGDILEADPGLS